LFLLTLGFLIGLHGVLNFSRAIAGKEPLDFRPIKKDFRFSFIGRKLVATFFGLSFTFFGFTLT